MKKFLSLVLSIQFLLPASVVRANPTDWSDMTFGEFAEKGEAALSKAGLRLVDEKNENRGFLSLLGEVGAPIRLRDDSIRSPGHSIRYEIEDVKWDGVKFKFKLTARDDADSKTEPMIPIVRLLELEATQESLAKAVRDLDAMKADIESKLPQGPSAGGSRGLRLIYALSSVVLIAALALSMIGAGYNLKAIANKPALSTFRSIAVLVSAYVGIVGGIAGICFILYDLSKDLSEE